jgi:hypothetical protein
MVYTLNLFRDLIANFNGSWDALEAFLTSPEGGNLIVNKSACGRYAIIHYDKTRSIMSVPHVQWFRSVVWDIQTMKPLSIAPPKAQDTLTESDLGTIQDIQEYLDGTNLNVYCAEGDTQFQLTSRTSFGAKGKFYSKKSFADLFKEALQCADDTIKAVFNFDECKPVAGEVSRFISILLQHPEHRIVEDVKAPRIWLLHIGIVRHDGTVVLNEGVCNIPTLPQPTGGEPVQSWFERIQATRDWRWRGAVFKDGAGKRWRMKNQVYQFIRDMRGNTPRITELFFTLRSRNMLTTYLSYYPEALEEFTRLEQWTAELVTKLHNLYNNVYKLRTCSIDSVAIGPESQFATHLRLMHAIFKNKKVVNDSHIRNYVSNMPVPRLMFLLRVTSGGSTMGAPCGSTTGASAPCLPATAAATDSDRIDDL